MKCKTFSNAFVKSNLDKAEWSHISASKHLSEDFIRENADKVNWINISYHQKLSENFINEFSDRVYWDFICSKQKLSEAFISKFSNKVNWFYLSETQKLSEYFIEKYYKKVDWKRISTYQILSESFIENFGNKVDWGCIAKYQKLSREFVDRFNIKLPLNNWLYKDVEYKRGFIDTSIYEVVDDYVIAYKSCRSDGYSRLNFLHKYEPGHVYEAHCDCNFLVRNSFGLSASTKDNAIKYCDEKLFKVKININDIGAITFDNNIRCFRLTVLEEMK